MKGLLDMLRDLKPLGQDDRMPVIKDVPIGAAPTYRSEPLGPKQIQWCRDNLANFAKYQDQALASKERK
jgi:hypothetical protein